MGLIRAAGCTHENLAISRPAVFSVSIFFDTFQDLVNSTNIFDMHSIFGWEVEEKKIFKKPFFSGKTFLLNILF